MVDDCLIAENNVDGWDLMVRLDGGRRWWIIDAFIALCEGGGVSGGIPRRRLGFVIRFLRIFSIDGEPMMLPHGSIDDESCGTVNILRHLLRSNSDERGILTTLGNLYWLALSLPFGHFSQSLT